MHSLSNYPLFWWYIICVSGWYRDMGRVEIMDCRANGEILFRAVRLLDPDSVEYPNRWDVQGWVLKKEMGYAIHGQKAEAYSAKNRSHGDRVSGKKFPHAHSPSSFQLDFFDEISLSPCFHFNKI